jgi:hypothetical protein
MKISRERERESESERERERERERVKRIEDSSRNLFIDRADTLKAPI